VIFARYVVDLDNEEARMKKRWRWPFAGFVLGALVGATVLTVNVVGASRPDPVIVRGAGFGEILHTPVLLARAGEPVELSYDVVCGAAKDEPGGHCSPSGSVFVRPAGGSKFSELPLERETAGLLSAVVPARETGGGFDYYVEMDNGRGQTASLPEAGAASPQHVWPLESWTTVDLGAARFGAMRAPSSVVRGFSWGRGDTAIGLDSGREQSRIGPSAFDVAPDGTVVVLDQVNRRLVELRPGAKPAHVPIDFVGGEGDLAVGADGSIYVLDSSETPMVRAFTAVGAPIAATPLGETTADMVRIGPSGPLVHAYPSEMWLPTGPGRPPLAAEQQLAAAQPARSVEGGLAVVVRASPAEVKVALVRGEHVVHTWRLHSETSFSEVQLAEPYRGGMVVVVRLWNEKRAEFRVLRLAPGGLVESFAVEPAEWAETASLSRFRLHGDTLYQLRSDPSGVEIARFEIGGTR
jgi:hypothetical protein